MRPHYIAHVPTFRHESEVACCSRVQCRRGKKKRLDYGKTRANRAAVSLQRENYATGQPTFPFQVYIRVHVHVYLIDNQAQVRGRRTSTKGIYENIKYA